jgi:hypothetical protein
MSLRVWSLAFLLVAFFSPVSAVAQNSDDKPDLPAVDISLVPRVVSNSGSKVLWEDPQFFSSPYGKPLTMSLDGENFFLRVSVTVFPQDSRYLLVVQQEVVGKKDGHGHMKTSVQSLLCTPGDRLVFYPFGRDDLKNNQELLLEIMVQPHGKTH